MIYTKKRSCVETGSRKRGKEIAKKQRKSNSRKKIIGGEQKSKSRNTEKCGDGGCQKRPHYGPPFTKLRLKCARHGRPLGYVNTTNKMCETCVSENPLHPEEHTLAYFGLPGGKALYCGRHRDKDLHVDLKNKKCAETKPKKCQTLPCYGPPGGKPKYCWTHKKRGHVDVKNPKCQEPGGCLSQPGYGPPGGKPTYCEPHQKPGDVELRHGKCYRAGCQVRPTFAEPGYPPLFCDEHCDREIHVNVCDPMCDECKTPTRASYGPEGGRRLKCGDHKGDYILLHRTCTTEKCPEKPTHGPPGGRAIKCKIHKGDYVDLKFSTCKRDPNCNGIPYFGTEAGKPLYCVVHNDGKLGDVTGKLCVECLRTPARWGVLFGKKTHCFADRKTNQVRIIPKCEMTPCKERPLYTNEDNDFPKRCDRHRKKGDKAVNVANYEVLVKKLERAKERAIGDFLIANGYHPVENKTVDAAYSRKRPDFSFGINPGTNHGTVSEVDENRHLRYLREVARMIELFRAYRNSCLAYRESRITFIRFNPDSFKTPSPFGKHHSFEQRTARLLHVIRALEVNPPSAPLTVVYLYYDGDDGINQVMEIDVDKEVIAPTPLYTL